MGSRFRGNNRGEGDARPFDRLRVSGGWLDRWVSMGLGGDAAVGEHGVRW